MSDIGIKICGITTAEALDASIAAGATHVGLVFFPKSPRNIEIGQAAALAARAGSRVQVVGLFVDPAPGQVEAALAQVPLDVIQLHGKEAPELCAQVAAATAREVWKAIGVRKRADLNEATRYRGAVTRVLYDAKPPEGADLPGGTGLRIDWSLMQGHTHPLPWILAGGLHAGNVGEAMGMTGARFVDTSSGVETQPGIKDNSRIAAFCAAARTQ
ncbi:phosphoribosylanthranilate isomerase [Novosphingobium sp. TH158]|uniref:phosphoribosylanthranilate isomerase n=1 Tax=Novosphingobium sp. TH158 TaxID=2067455 RepID=UPI000C7C230D|nr:phosphoribosylanthranilate isomerase [Novosphingobium sp. TH158]PLK24289.1 phosphoribosylanthranilate isomerase [Novosphingobium sp. TH158]